MASSRFVRGDLLSLVRTDAPSVSHKGFHPGDTVRVGGRKKGGWLRVRSTRTGDLMWIRNGRHLCLTSEAYRPASQIDLLIRESQVRAAEKAIEATQKSLDEWKDAFHDAYQKLLDETQAHKATQNQLELANQSVEDLVGQIAEVRRQIVELRPQIAELQQQRVVVSGESLGEYREMQQAEDEAMGFFDPNN
jgi:HPt (histidine-containing phosphotransfer) domain-containing protein